MNIVVLVGRLSPERDVSLSLGSLVCQSLIRLGYNVILLDLYLGYQKNIDDIFEVFEGHNNQFYIVPPISRMCKKERLVN